jgi:hypothetical protein
MPHEIAIGGAHQAPLRMEGAQNGEHIFDIVPTRYHPSRSHDPTARTRMLCNHCCAASEPVHDQQAERNRRFACVVRAPRALSRIHPLSKWVDAVRSRCVVGAGKDPGPGTGNPRRMHGPRPGTQPEVATTNIVLSENYRSQGPGNGISSEAKTGSPNRRLLLKVHCLLRRV